MSRFSKRRDDRDLRALESRLRDEKPQPSDDLMLQASRLAARSHRRPTRRLGLALAVGMLTVIAFSLTGGIGYAASTASSGTAALKHLIIKPAPQSTAAKVTAHSNSAARAQYETKELICHRDDNGREITLEVTHSVALQYIARGDTRGACVQATPPPPPVTEDQDLICHRDDNGQEITILVSHSVGLQHLAHGDTLGACKGKAVKPAKKKVAMCHLLRTGKSRTILVKATAVRGHLKHGDTRGRCKVKAAKKK